MKFPGHKNRIKALKCHPDDSNLVITAGLDRQVKIYDVRKEGPVCSFFGPEIHGDSIDVFGDTIVACSNRRKD